MTRRQASLDVAARVVAPFAQLSPLKAFDTTLHQSASGPQVVVCYQALRRLPGRDSHPLERCSGAQTLRAPFLPNAHRLHDTPCIHTTCRTRHSSPQRGCSTVVWVLIGTVSPSDTRPNHPDGVFGLRSRSAESPVLRTSPCPHAASTTPVDRWAFLDRLCFRPAHRPSPFS